MLTKRQAERISAQYLGSRGAISRDELVCAFPPDMLAYMATPRVITPGKRYEFTIDRNMAYEDRAAGYFENWRPRA